MYVHDELFIMPEGVLNEGKAIGSVAAHDMALKSNLNKLVHLDAAKFSKQVKSGRTYGKKKLNEIQTRVHTTVFGALGLLRGKKITESDFKKRVVKTMKVAWRDAFLAGVRSAGVQGSAVSGGKVKMESSDGVWLRSAMTHEMRFLNKFIKDLVEDTGTMSASRRLKMYTDSIQSFYDSARVIGLPENALLYWTGPADKTTCPGCAYMFEHSPFTKYTLPTVPRSGATACLTNCRDRLLVRLAPLEEVQAADSPDGRDRHLSALMRLKQGR